MPRSRETANPHRRTAALLAATMALLIGLAAQAPAQVQPPPAEEPEPPAGQPRNEAAPVVTRSDNTLTTTNGRWIGADPDGYSYSWLRCADAEPSTCSPVAGRRAHTYALSSDDAGKVVRSRVTASNRAGESFADSEAFGPLPANEPLPAPPPRPEGDASDARRLNPFPVVVVAGRVGPRMTRVTGFVVRGPRKALVRVRCSGSRQICPVRSVRRRIPSSKRLRLRVVQQTYRAGAVLDVRVTRPEKIGKFTRIRFRRDRTPQRIERCLEPGRAAPVVCG